MDIIFTGLEEAFHKDLILQYLRWKQKDPPKNILQIKDEAFGQTFDFQKTRYYCEELLKDKRIENEKRNPSDVRYLEGSSDFIESQGYVRQLFLEKGIHFDNDEFIEAYHKDLMLYWLKPSSEWWQLIMVRLILFPLLEANTIRYYRDKLEQDGYVKIGTGRIVLQYYKDSDRFLKEGGYTGRYLSDLINEQGQLSEEVKIKENRRRIIEERKEYLENRKTNCKFYAVKYGPWVLIIIVIIGLVLIRIKVIPVEIAIKFFKWFLKILGIEL
jgi:hypothetical protein